NRRVLASHEELAAKTRDLIQQNTSFMAMAENVPVYRIDDKYLTRVRELPTPADRAAELEAALNRELIEGGGGFLYRTLGERLLPAGWAESAGGRKKVSVRLQVVSWDTEYEKLSLCPVEVDDPPFLQTAVEELARTT